MIKRKTERALERALRCALKGLTALNYHTSCYEEGDDAEPTPDWAVRLKSIDRIIRIAETLTWHSPEKPQEGKVEKAEVGSALTHFIKTSGLELKEPSNSEQFREMVNAMPQDAFRDFVVLTLLGRCKPCDLRRAQGDLSEEDLAKTQKAVERQMEKKPCQAKSS